MAAIDGTSAVAADCTYWNQCCLVSVANTEICVSLIVSAKLKRALILAVFRQHQILVDDR